MVIHISNTEVSAGHSSARYKLNLTVIKDVRGVLRTLSDVFDGALLKNT